jgi:L-fuculose-phosphate aldolase
MTKALYLNAGGCSTGPLFSLSVKRFTVQDTTFFKHLGKGDKHMLDYARERADVAAMMSRLYRCRLTTTSGGNISLRLSPDLFCITPSKLDKANLSADTIALVAMDGTNLTPDLPLSIESEMHRQALLNRSDISAVIHAHPCHASAFTALGPAIDTKLLAESWYLLEEPAFAPYQRMGTAALAASVASCLKRSNVVLMENHGVLTVGKTLLEAFDLIEVLENAAHMTVIVQTMSLGGSFTSSPLTQQRCEELMEMKGPPTTKGKQ